MNSELSSNADGTLGRRVRVLRIGSSFVAVDDEHVLAVVGFVEPTPLPFSPATVLGIVSIEGKMFTVLETDDPQEKRAQLLALRGDEQLAIAVDESETPIEIDPGMISERDINGTSLSQGKFTDRGREIQLLDVGKLFSELVQGRERRRRRT